MLFLALIFGVVLSPLAASGQTKRQNYLDQKYNLSLHQKKISSVIRATIANARPHSAMSYLQSGERVHVVVEVEAPREAGNGSELRTGPVAVGLDVREQAHRSGTDTINIE